LSTSRLLIAAMIAATIILTTLGAGPAAAASSTVECGQLSAYTAPDPLGPTDGSLQIGTLPTWDVIATATVSPAATAALPSIVNSGPTCLALDLDVDGNVTAIDFAASGTITGTVAFSDPYYLFDDRLIIPTFITDANPGLAALFVTSYQAGTSLTVTFTVDTETGAFTGFDGTAKFCGKAKVTADGDGQVGDAIIPASVLDATDLAAIAGAGAAQACATVHAIGTIDPDSGGISITTDVTIKVAAATVPTAPPTSIAGAVRDDTTVHGLDVLVLGLAFVSAIAVAMRRFRVTGA
jgi:hypothetical protein